MLKILNATSLGLSTANSAQFALRMYFAAENRQIINKNPCFNVQAHTKSLLLVAIKSPCTTSY